MNLTLKIALEKADIIYVCVHPIFANTKKYKI